MALVAARSLPALLLTTLTGVAAAQRPEPPFFQSLAWAPDGNRLVASAVLESWDAGYGVYLIGLDGSAPHRLDTGAGRSALYPVFSPDGRRIAFGMRLGDEQAIWEIGVDGANLRRVIAADRAGAPGYAPDGSRLTYHAQVDSVRQVFVTNRDGSGARRVAPGPGPNWNPLWSPNGEWIAYYSSRRGGGRADTIYVARPDGTEERQVTAGVFPTWTPDGRLLFTARDGEDSHLFVVNLDGSGRRRVAERVVFGVAAPDGRRIAAVAYHRPDGGGAARYRVDIMRIDGSDRRTIAGTPGPR